MYICISQLEFGYTASLENVLNPAISYKLQVLLFNAIHFDIFIFFLFTLHTDYSISIYPENATSSFILPYAQTRIFYFLFQGNNILNNMRKKGRNVKYLKKLSNNFLTIIKQ